MLAAAMSTPSLALLALCIGGMGLAVSAGVVFLPATTGAGVREVVFGVLLALLTSGQVVAVVIASRVIILLADLLLRGLFSFTWGQGLPLQEHDERSVIAAVDPGVARLCVHLCRCELLSQPVVGSQDGTVEVARTHGVTHFVCHTGNMGLARYRHLGPPVSDHCAFLGHQEARLRLAAR